MTIQQEIWNFIHQETGVTRKDIKTQFSDLDQKQVSNAISRLMEKSYVIRTDEGRYYTDKVMVTNEPASEPFDQLVDTLPTSRKPSRMDIVGHNGNEGLHYPGDVGDENHHVNHVESEQPLQLEDIEALKTALSEREKQAKFYADELAKCKKEIQKISYEYHCDFVEKENIQEELENSRKNALKLVDENDRLNSLKDKMQDELEKLRNSKAYFEPAHDSLLEENKKLTDQLTIANQTIERLKQEACESQSEAQQSVQLLKDELMKRRFPVSEEPTSPHEFIFGLMSELPFESSFVFTKGSVPYLNIHGTLIEVQQDQWQQIIKYINALAPYMIEEQTDNFVHFKAA